MKKAIAILFLMAVIPSTHAKKAQQPGLKPVYEYTCKDMYRINTIRVNCKVKGEK